MNMVRVEKNIGVLQLLALGFAGLFFIVQTQASTHTHDPEGGQGVLSECAICIVDSQLDDAIAADIEPNFRSLPKVALTLKHECALARVTVSTKARAPPVS